MNLRLTPGLALLVSTWLPAATLDLSIEIPRLKVAEYHRPYVAVWIERADASVAANLSLWYQQTRATGPDANGARDGSKWLKDLRQWWRRSGRVQRLPIDGVSGATRPEGPQALHFSDSDPQLRELVAGDYRLVVEAVREVGGRELLKLDFSWPPGAAVHRSVRGKTELGAIELDLHP